MGSTPRFRLALEILGMALTYVFLARVGHSFSAESNGISPLWLPSGVSLALVVYRGKYLLTGVFLGSLLLNCWAYIDFSAFSAIFPGLGAALLTGIGDLICVGLGVWALDRCGGIAGVFRSIRGLGVFMGYAVAAGSLVSTVLGVTGLLLVGRVTGGEALSSGAVWFLGDTAGVLLLAPFLLSFTLDDEELPRGDARLPERLALALLVFILPMVSPVLRTVGLEFRMDFMVSPLLLAVLLRAGLRPALGAAVCLVAMQLFLLKQQEAFGLSVHMTPISLHLLIAVNAVSLLVVGALLWQQREMLAKAVEEATHDALTGLLNRRSGIPRLEKELSRSVRYGSPLSLVIFDIDHFKDVNDNYGHAQGDAVLRDLSRLANRDLREHDMLARWGGEEFLLMLPATDLAGAGMRAERLRNQIAEASLGGKHRVTISAGVAQLKRGMGIDDLLAYADRALYAAKERGRNRTELAGSPVPYD